ncbi:gap junction alpha-9 protein-like [Microcaecilia unicolor]|uniref:Gap junction alpha-9 protein-like n=1 Tax=Microcaecilia unicolor TaxID=1415580 RepID=A0A6P7X3M3_9AMPH|nr:gap junction alpha-9 protein-like [Microcaecilia unicolor]XP_030066127.1 gap junction alpha-9 protein-like [Microcaecilia unicolor]
MAMVTGLIPILRTAIEATTDYNGRTMWFGFLAIRLLTLYVSEMPWSKLDLDFQCNGNVSEFCRKSCFNQHFDVPVVALWNFTYILFIISVLLMELFAAQLRHNLIKDKIKQELLGPFNEGEQTNLTGVKGHDLAQKDIMIDFHQQKKLLCLYLLCILLRLVIELGFFYILIYWHLPKVNGAPINCSTLLCPGPFHCLVRASVEKRMSIYMLSTISVGIIIICCVFGFYSICHYLLLKRSQPRNAK